MYTDGYSTFHKNFSSLCSVSRAPAHNTGLCTRCETTSTLCRCGHQSAGAIRGPQSAPIMSPRSLSLARFGGGSGGEAAAVLSTIPGVESPADASAGAASAPHALSDSGLGDDRCPCEILPYLLLGSARHSADFEVLCNSNVTAILNVSNSCPRYFEDRYTYQQIPVEDSTTANLGQHFEETFQFIGTSYLKYFL